MIPISSYLSNLPNQAINRVMWPSYLKKWYLYHPIWETLPNQAKISSCDHHIWNHMKKCYLMIPISSYLSNLPNQAIFRVMWPLDLKLHEKKCCLMVPISSHLSNLPNLANIQSHVTITIPTEIFCSSTRGPDILWLVQVTYYPASTRSSVQPLLISQL